MVLFAKQVVENALVNVALLSARQPFSVLAHAPPFFTSGSMHRKIPLIQVSRFHAAKEISLLEKFFSTEIDHFFNSLLKFCSKKTLHIFIPEQTDLLRPNEFFQLYLPTLIHLLID
jgi:hypothetical protein